MPPPSNLERELEELRESNHRLKLSLESSKQLHQNEVEYLKDELQIKEKELNSVEEKLKAKVKRKEADGEIASLSEAYSLAAEEIVDLKGQIQQLQRTIEQLRSVQTDRHNFHEESESLKIQADRLNIELKTNRDLLEVQQSKVHELTQQSLQEKASINHLREELESRDGYIQDLNSRLREMEKDKQDAIMELQQLLMLQQSARQETEDPTRRGNSLFCEVDERRVRVEEELTRLRERVARLTAESYDYRTRAERGETRNGMILRQLELMERNEINVVKEFKKLQSETVPMFNQYRDKLEALKAEYMRKLKHYRDGVQSPGIGEMESLRGERDLLLGQNMGLEHEIWDLRKDLKYATSRLTDSEARCMILRTKLQGLQEGVMSDKRQLVSEGMENGSLMESSLNGTLAPGSNGSGGDANGNKNWLYETILNDTRVAGPAGDTPPLPPPPNANRKPKTQGASTKQVDQMGEDIAECKQQ